MSFHLSADDTRIWGTFIYDNDCQLAATKSYIENCPQVVLGELNEYHLILRVLFWCFKPPTVITRSLARVGYYGGRFKTRK